jgi:hypothetical protein
LGTRENTKKSLSLLSSLNEKNWTSHDCMLSLLICMKLYLFPQMYEIHCRNEPVHRGARGIMKLYFQNCLSPFSARAKMAGAQTVGHSTFCQLLEKFIYFSNSLATVYQTWERAG